MVSIYLYLTITWKHRKVEECDEAPGWRLVKASIFDDMMGPWISALLVTVVPGPGPVSELRDTSVGHCTPSYRSAPHNTTTLHTNRYNANGRNDSTGFYLNMHVSLTIIYTKMYTSMHSFMRWIRSNCQYSSLLKKDMLSKQPFRQIRYLQISNDVALVTWILISLLWGSGNPWRPIVILLGIIDILLWRYIFIVSYSVNIYTDIVHQPHHPSS